MHFGVPIAINIILVFLGSESNRVLDACLGNFHKHYEKSGTQLCTSEDFFRNMICRVSFTFYSLLSSNIPEAFLLFKCFNKIKEQTDKSQTMIGEASYQQRRR